MAELYAQYQLYFPIQATLGFAVVAFVYYVLPVVRWRVIWLLLVSYLFYVYWNPIFIFLILASTCIDFLAAKGIAKSKEQSSRKMYLWLSIGVNLCILFYFKYYNFLRENLQLVLDWIDLSIQIPAHHWMLPVGISFYTFQTLSYTIDVYRGEKSVENNWFDFALYVAFFPQLIAGPIERSSNLLPQFKTKFGFNYENVRSGLLLILFGVFKKIVVADRFAIYADKVFDKPEAHSGMTVVWGLLFFSFQIYCDFSAYTDMARGAARVLGMELMENFKGPYWSGSIREFWRRWHISLSTWFRDYLYIPLGGNQAGITKLYRNLVIVFLVTGIWHGASWTFVIWGLYHGTFLILERIGWGRILRQTPYLFQVAYTFLFVTLGWVFFRANNIQDAFQIFGNILPQEGTFFTSFKLSSFVDQVEFKISVILLFFITIIHYLEYKIDIIKHILMRHFLFRWLIYITLIYAIGILGQHDGYQPFIYFQF